MDKISIVTSLYKSEKYVNTFYETYKEIIKKLSVDYEFIFVDDGYPDKASENVKSIILKDKKVKLIKLSRNFGQHHALFAGFDYASGNLVYVTDVDLEEPAKNLIEFYNIIKNEEDVDVVYGVFTERTGGLSRGFLGKVFFRIFNFLSEFKISENQAWQRLMKREYVNALLLHREYESIVAGLMKITGFNQKPFEIIKSYKGETSYNLKNRLLVGINGIISFSTKPLVYISILGLIISFISFGFIFYIVFCKLFVRDYQAGWSTLISSIWCVGGILMFSIGLVGIYLSKVFKQVKNRPFYIIKEIIN
jgi:putative glycosyltransferase